MNFIVREPRAMNRVLEMDSFLGKGHDEQTKSKSTSRFFKLNRREERKGKGKYQLLRVAIYAPKGKDIRGPHEEKIWRDGVFWSRKCAFIFTWTQLFVEGSGIACVHFGLPFEFLVEN